MTLFLLALAATAMLELAVESHHRALQALTAQENLQKLWGALSCERVLLPRCDAVLMATRDRLKKPSPRVAASCLLGEQQFAIVLSDEEAKLNVNMLASRLQNQALVDVVKRAVVDATLVRLQPTQTTIKNADGKPVTADTYGTFGQLFVYVPPSQLMGGVVSTGLSDQITCWGDGKLNITAAAPETLERLCELELNADQEKLLHDALVKSPSKPLRDVIAGLKVPDAKLVLINKLLTETSTCHSVWIAADIGGRPTYRFVVASMGRQPETVQFVW